MRYSFMTFSTPDLSLEENLSLAASLGYDGLEPRIDADHRHGVELDTTSAARQTMRDQAQKAGVAYACVATSCRYADPAIAAEEVTTAHRAIDLAADIGAPCIRIFGGQMGQGLTREQAMEGVCAALGSIAEHAGERGVTVCMETHDDWCDPRHVAEVLRRVNHPAIAANWDVMHPVRTGLATIDESFAILKPFIRHLHIHDGEPGSTALAPIGQGTIDHRRVIELLNTIPFEGFLSGEWIDWEPYQVHLPRELAALKAYESAIRGEAAR
jgi:sugar phosphate isomerase/epimerase